MLDMTIMGKKVKYDVENDSYYVPSLGVHATKVSEIVRLFSKKTPKNIWALWLRHRTPSFVEVEVKQIIDTLAVIDYRGHTHTINICDLYKNTRTNKKRCARYIKSWNDTHAIGKQYSNMSEKTYTYLDTIEKYDTK